MDELIRDLICDVLKDPYSKTWQHDLLIEVLLERSADEHYSVVRALDQVHNTVAVAYEERDDG